MLVSAKAEYACVAMLELASRAAQARPVRLAEIADRHGIPQPFLVQILLQLKSAGLVHSNRGASGGYSLARPPEEVTLYDIIAVVDRWDGNARANDPLIASPYVQNLRNLWERIHQAQVEILKQTTLAELEQQSNAWQYVI